ncbi:RND transporter [Sphingobium herbicidovorans NBRC 16415]|uniref:RND transporter n=2 Tax=Sphingobium herbicidovorans TaxID=76947 RepID=A0A086P606_SPHHM|nr:efflux transporter outer membrane subunit [Sphingobium herbicidovorans]KFG88824.1 RND transporter [Sphingobium herbicidovorans NBRC 16415]
MRRGTACLLLLLMTAGCTAGPDYHGPQNAAPATPPAFVRGDASQGAIELYQPWWTTLADPVLDQLMSRALASNPRLDAAAARIRQARSALRQRKADGLPTINGSAIHAKARLPGQADDGGATTLDLYNVGFDASWELDLFGGHHRAVEAARADIATREADLADVRVSLSAEIAQSYVDLRDRQQRLILGLEALALQDEEVALTRQRFERGTIARGDLLQQEYDRDGARARLAPIRAEIDGFKDKIAVLTGTAPGTLDALLDAPSSPPLPPAQVAVGDPAALLRRRPDIRAAERKLAAQTARIGVADAARFPRISFLGLVGLGGSSPKDLLDLDKFTVAAAPRISWSFLDFGKARSRVDAAEAQRDEAAANYRNAVLAALQDAEGALSRFQHQRESLTDLVHAEGQAKTAADLARQRSEAGTISRINYLSARRSALEATQAKVRAMVGLTESFINIQKALGLGWQGMPAEGPQTTH